MSRVTIPVPTIGSAVPSTGIMDAMSLVAREQEQIRQGAARAASGYLLAEQGYRSAAENTLYAAAFNANIDRVNTIERLRATARSYDKLLGQQVVAAASSGISVTSKSAMLLQNEAQDAKARELRMIQQNATSQRQAAKFETNIRVNNLNQQATAMKMAADEELLKAEKRIMENTVRQNATNAVRVNSLLGSLL